MTAGLTVIVPSLSFTGLALVTAESRHVASRLAMSIFNTGWGLLAAPFDGCSARFALVATVLSWSQ